METKYWIMLLIVIGLLGYGVISSKRDKALLADCSKITTAVIIDKYRIRKRGHFMKYAYTLNEVEYQSTKSLTKKNEVNFFSWGDTIQIRYSCKDPSVSTFIKDF